MGAERARPQSTRSATATLDKVVLARALDVTAPAMLDPRAVAARLAARFPSCFTFVCDGLVGASPELLVRRLGRHAESLVLAGTVRRGGDAEEDAALERELLASAKDAVEHRIAADSVREVFAAVAADVVSDRLAAAAPARQRDSPRDPRRGMAHGSSRRRHSRWRLGCTRPRRSAGRRGLRRSR